MPLRDTSKMKISISGEPPEVKEIRDKIVDKFADLEFVDEGHKYYLYHEDNTKEELTSVSNIAHMFSEEFDTEAQAAKYALKHGETPEYWMDKWKFNSLKATTTGTLVHSFAESYGWLKAGHPELITEECRCKYIEDKNWLIPTRGKEESAMNCLNGLDKNLHLVMNETKVFSEKFKLNYAGTFDALYYYKHPTDDSKSGLVVLDWKGLDINTPILTTEGWKTMGTISVGDTVFDKNGKPTNVLHTSSIHHKKCYKVTLDNNHSVIADYDHRWEVCFVKGNKERNEVMTTEELFNYINELNAGKRYSYRLPKIKVHEAIDGKDIDLPIDPYVLGVWLCDGNSSCGDITNMYDSIFNEINRRGFEIGNDISGGGCGIAKTRTIFGLYEKLKQESLLQNKHIPYKYLIASKKQKMDLLRGLMDADGYYNPNRKRCVFNTTKEQQVKFCVEILSALGIKCTVISDDKKTPSYEICFNPSEYPFLCRNVDVCYKNTFASRYYNFRSIELVDSVETRCIEVDSDTHTFLYGYDMITTHNTNKDLYSEYNRKHDKMMLYPFNDLHEESLGAYTIQLSAYQIPLEDMGLKVIARRVAWLKEDGEYELVPLPDVTERLRDYLTNYNGELNK